MVLLKYVCKSFDTPITDNSPWTRPNLSAWPSNGVWQKWYYGTSKSASSKPRGFHLGSLQCSHWSPKSLCGKFYHLEMAILWRRPSQPAWQDQRRDSETGYREIGISIQAPARQPSTVPAPATVWWQPVGWPRGSQPSWAFLNSCPLETVMIVVTHGHVQEWLVTRPHITDTGGKGKVFDTNPHCCPYGWSKKYVLVTTTKQTPFSSSIWTGISLSR